jgi:predicted nucleic acid-binding protein
LLNDEDLVITLNVLEEVAYVGLSAIYGCRGFKLRDKVRKGLNDECESFLDGLSAFIEEFHVKMIPPPSDPLMFLDIIRTYRLLPADAAIAASCKYHGIKKIATLDADFKRVDFLEVIEA